MPAIPLILVLLGSATAILAGESYDRALSQYNKTDYASVIDQLRPAANDAKSLALLGQAYLMSQEFHLATETFEKVVALEPGVSMYHDWLGRVYGRRAENAFPLAAIGLATHARDAFEKAVRLNPSNGEAVNDLFEFYLQAPGLLGGGQEKARALLPLIEKNDAAEGHFALARLYEQEKNYTAAEAEYRKAVEAAPRNAGRMIDLAKFLASRGRTDESDNCFLLAEKLHPDAPHLMYARAQTWIKAKRNLEQARDLLRRYIASTNLTPDDPSRADAMKLLKKSGD